MRRDLLSILCCPACRSGLRLSVDLEEQGEVITGTLECTGCHQAYPIVERIPNLLPPEKPAPA